MLMLRPIYLRLEYRDNAGNPLTVIRRVNVVQTNDTEANRVAKIQKWAGEAGKMLALSMDGQTIKEIREAALEANRRQKENP